MKKISIILLLVSILCLNSCGLFEDGYLYVGDGWQDTPEKALAQAADDTIESEQMLTVVHLLDTRYIDDIAIMTFVSKGDTLVTATFVTNEKGGYHYYGHTEEVVLNDPTEFVLNGDSEQFILFPYQHYNTNVFGWSYSSASFTVNGRNPDKKTYTFTCQGKEWSLDFWWIDGVSSNMEVTIEYVNG